VRPGPIGVAAPCLVVFPNWVWPMRDYVCLPSFVVSVPNHLPTARLGVCLVAWAAPHAAQVHSFHTQDNRGGVVTFQQINMAKKFNSSN
jgi:hypothetical protein